MNAKTYPKSFNKNQMNLVETLSVNSLKIAAYQSPCNPLRVKRIVENFDEEQLQPIDVSFRDKHYWIVDGQHRTEALKEKGIPMVACRIHYGLTYQKEANLYVALNNPKNRRTPTAVNRANAQLEANDPAMMEIKRIVEENGFILGLDQSKAINKIVALATLETIHKQIGAAGLNRVLGLIHGAWYGKFEAMDKAVLMGVYLFVKHYQDDFKDRDFIDKLSKVHPRDIKMDGKSNKQYSQSTYTPYGISVLYYFNKNRIKKLPNKF